MDRLGIHQDQENGDMQVRRVREHQENIRLQDREPSPPPQPQPNAMKQMGKGRHPLGERSSTLGNVVVQNARREQSGRAVGGGSA